MKKIIIVIICGLLAVGVTGPKLYKMCQIKGWVPGAEIETVIITQKWNQTPDIHPSGRNTFWISWTEKDIKQIGNHRTNVFEDRWNEISIGDSIEVIHVIGDRSPYLRDDIFVTAENFLFDIALLIGELSMAIYFSIQIFNRKRIVNKYMS